MYTSEQQNAFIDKLTNECLQKPKEEAMFRTMGYDLGDIGKVENS